MVRSVDTAFPQGPGLTALLRLGLQEDIGSGDATTVVAVDPQARAEGLLVPREAGVVAGLPLLAYRLALRHGTAGVVAGAVTFVALVAGRIAAGFLPPPRPSPRRRRRAFPLRSRRWESQPPRADEATARCSVRVPCR